MAYDINVITGITGQSISAKLVPFGTAYPNHTITMSEIGTEGRYFGDMTGIESGSFYVLFYVGTQLFDTGIIYWDGTKEIIPGTLTPEQWTEIKTIRVQTDKMKFTGDKINAATDCGCD